MERAVEALEVNWCNEFRFSWSPPQPQPISTFSLYADLLSIRTKGSPLTRRSVTREEEKTLRAVYEFATEFECDTNAYIENDLFSIKKTKNAFLVLLFQLCLQGNEMEMRSFQFSRIILA